MQLLPEFTAPHSVPDQPYLVQEETLLGKAKALANVEELERLAPLLKEVHCALPTRLLAQIYNTRCVAYVTGRVSDCNYGYRRPSVDCTLLLANITCARLQFACYRLRSTRQATGR